MMIGRLLLLGVIVVFVGLALMFDWFGARSYFETGVEKTQSTVESLTEAGDNLQKASERLQETFKSKE